MLDSNLESKLLNLWSFLEAQWSKEDKEDRLLSEAEFQQTKQALKNILSQEKYDKALNEISKLKSKTRNMKIIEGITNLAPESGWDVKKMVRDIFELRGRLAHGHALSDEEEIQQAQAYVSFILNIIGELIDQKIEDRGLDIRRT